MTVGLGRHLSRTKPHRMALLKNLASQLFQHGAIVSTTPKLKEAQRYAERIITIAKKARESPERHIPELQSRLFLSGDNSKLLRTLVDEIAGRYTQRNGGYTRLLKLEPRLGDRAPTSMLELVDTPVVDSNGVLQKGNMKLWLNVKAAMNSHANGEAFTELTLKNLQKMAKMRNFQEFIGDIAKVRELILKNENTTSTDEESRQFLDSLKAGIENYKPVKPEPKSYQFISERPARH